ncbi:nucleotidyl transferase AbiEii/AbiGii toxin family protein [uncultured Sphingomonas sp.]|uniref:nucleotidyl transferase AbiEii/AbiGii toxin family protein n=1 Tax=uncultured Sphingomonas sp. TaxID=158754 RepID=UPI002604BD3E|nr:nucleotidyl transferase AbiEii/AbiGii toxin family protein [uncultured Sphingomonas sp.]
MAAHRPSQWPLLFDLAIEILGHFQAAQGFAPDWSFGGGTALMLQIDHRESHDIDIFLDDPQVLPFLNPETQGYAFSRRPDGYQTDGAGALKLAYAGVGEIDFICSTSIVDNPVERRELRGQRVALERPAEIIAKKVYFRGTSFQPRDMFDLAAVVEHSGSAYAIAALSQCGAARCAAALATVDKANPDYVRSIVGQLMYRDTRAHLVAEAQAISHATLEAALSSARSS